MNNISEVNRKSMYFEEKGFACGPVSDTAIMAEIVVDVDGQRIYLHGEWNELAGDEYSFEATTESLFFAMEKVRNASNDDEERKAIADRDRIIQESIKDDAIFESYYAELKQIIHDEMKAHGFEVFPEDE